MLTAAMYSAPTMPDASHRVTAPGGYEWWYFDAEDAVANVRIVAILFDGFVFHPGYLRAMARFEKNPTGVSPPLPRAYPCAYLAVYRQNRLVSQFMSQFAEGSCDASTEKLHVNIGPNSARIQDDGSVRVVMHGNPWVITGTGPKTLATRLSAELTFRPRLEHVPQPRRFLSRAMTGADHFWILANPLCDLSGNVRLDGIDGFELSLNGRGYHDHNLGTGPIGSGLCRWMWGRVLEADRVTTFHAAYPSDARLPEELHLQQSDPIGTTDISVSASRGSFDRLSPMLLRYPSRWTLDDQLKLSNPTLLDSTPFYLRLLYDAELSGLPARAMCEIAYPHRLRWPVLGRMIEMSIDTQRRPSVR